MSTKENSMDDVDFKNFQELQKNGRQRYKEIAKNLRVSGGTVRIPGEKMLAQGLVKISALINPFLFEHYICAVIGINLARRAYGEKMGQLSGLKGGRFCNECDRQIRSPC
jgi:Lrp/AsnC family transcriptional regulator for asnA, asnC and gidA